MTVLLGLTINPTQHLFSSQIPLGLPGHMAQETWLLATEFFLAVATLKAGNMLCRLVYFQVQNMLSLEPRKGNQALHFLLCSGRCAIQ